VWRVTQFRCSAAGYRSDVVPDPLKTGVRGPAERQAEQQDETVHSGGRDEEQQIASGRPSTTPFAVVGLVALVIWAVAAVVALVAFVVIWLV
jgi:hypothetical protein